MLEWKDYENSIKLSQLLLKSKNFEYYKNFFEKKNYNDNNSLFILNSIENLNTLDFLQYKVFLFKNPLLIEIISKTLIEFFNLKKLK
jgi:hypothetical protein